MKIVNFEVQKHNRAQENLSSVLAHHAERSPNNPRDLTANPQGSIRPKQIREYHLAGIPKSDRFSPVWRNARP